MPNVTMFSSNISMKEVDGERSWWRYRGPDLMLHQIAQLEFFYVHGYITKYSVDHAIALSHPQGLYGFSFSNLDRAKVHILQVPRDLCPEVLKGRIGFNGTGVISTTPLSVWAAAKLVQHDIDALVSGDALLKNMATKERLGLIPKGLQEADAAAARAAKSPVPADKIAPISDPGTPCFAATCDGITPQAEDLPAEVLTDLHRLHDAGAQSMQQLQARVRDDQLVVLIKHALEYTHAPSRAACLNAALNLLSAS